MGAEPMSASRARRCRWEGPSFLAAQVVGVLGGGEPMSTARASRGRWEGPIFLAGQVVGVARRGVLTREVLCERTSVSSWHWCVVNPSSVLRKQGDLRALAEFCGQKDCFPGVTKVR